MLYFVLFIHNRSDVQNGLSNTAISDRRIHLDLWTANGEKFSEQIISDRNISGAFSNVRAAL